MQDVYDVADMNKGEFTILRFYLIFLSMWITDVDGNVKVELVNGTNAYEGRVEIIHNGTRGTVCDDGWDIKDAAVICRMLGYYAEEESYSEAKYGQGTGTIWLDNVRCNGNESTIEECSKRSWGNHDCYHTEDAGVRCRPHSRLDTSYAQNYQIYYLGIYIVKIVNLAAELVNGPNAYTGRVELISGGIRGTVCDDDWDDTDAAVICRMLGHGTGGVSYSSATYGQGTGKIWLDDVQCNGDEARIEECPKRAWGQHDCTHGDDAGVRCFPQSYVPANTTANLAFQKPTLSSSMSQHSSYAVDGNVGTYLSSDHCSQTDNTDQTPWWMVDLHGTFVVNSLVITNRGDAEWGKLHSFVIEIFAQNPHTCRSIASQVCLNYTGAALGRAERRRLTCDTPTRGRFVRIRKWGVDVLTLCEVEIYGIPKTECEFPSRYPSTKNIRFITQHVELITGPTLLECTVNCERKNNCLAFNFNENSHQCELIFNPIFNDTKKIIPDWRYYGSDLCEDGS